MKLTKSDLIRMLKEKSKDNENLVFEKNKILHDYCNLKIDYDDKFQAIIDVEQLCVLILNNEGLNIRVVRQIISFLHERVS